MRKWEKVVDAFYRFKEAKYRLCRYHNFTHYADRSVVEKVPVRDNNTLLGYKLVSKYYYHGVQIAEYDGKILTINCQGYLTVTTRDRLNAIVPHKFKVSLAQEDNVYIAMYIHSYKEKKNYVIATDWFNYHDVKIDVRNCEIINKNELKEIVFIKRKGRRKVDIAVDENNVKYVNVKGKGLIRLTDMKTFKLGKYYAIESNVDLFKNVKNLRELLNLVKSLDKEAYLKLIRD